MFIAHGCDHRQSMNGATSQPSATTTRSAHLTETITIDFDRAARFGVSMNSIARQLDDFRKAHPGCSVAELREMKVHSDAGTSVCNLRDIAVIDRAAP
jgi:hypothetical protein